MFRKVALDDWLEEQNKCRSRLDRLEASARSDRLSRKRDAGHGFAPPTERSLRRSVLADYHRR